MDGTAVAVYRQGALTGVALRTAIDQALAEIAGDPAALVEIGIDRVDAQQVTFEVVEEPGFDPTLILLTIAIGAASSLTADAAKALWRRVAKLVKHKEGDDAFGEQQSPPSA